MRIAIIPTAGRIGTTTVSVLVAQALAFTQHKTVRLCYTYRDDMLKEFLGISAEDHDPTRTISQVSKLLQAHAIEPEGLSDYCHHIATNFELLDSFDPTLTDEELDELTTFTFARSTTDYTICDCAFDLNDPLTRSIVKASDTVVLIGGPGLRLMRETRRAVESGFIPPNKVRLVIVNNYDEQIADLKYIAGQSGVRLRDCCKVHYNPWVTKCCNRGELDSIMSYVINRDPRVLPLLNDFKEITQFFCAIAGDKHKWEV